MTRNESGETADVAEVKMPSQIAAIELQEDIELDAKRTHLMKRKDMLCTKIATDIRLSGIESIPDWVARISNDIIAWSNSLKSFESELAKINVEAALLRMFRESRDKYVRLGQEERSLLDRLEKIRAEGVILELGISTYGSDLARIRGHKTSTPGATERSVSSEADSMTGIRWMRDDEHDKVAINQISVATGPKCENPTPTPCSIADAFTATGQEHYCNCEGETDQ